MKAYQNLIYGAIATLLLFTSCCLGDKVAEYDYLVTNNSDTTITVDVVANELESTTFQTRFTIGTGETLSVLMSSGAIVSACEDLEYTDTKIDTDLESLSVTNQDSILSTRDYLDGNEWNFDEGIYRITVEQGEF